jgi:hypothetical protein
VFFTYSCASQGGANLFRDNMMPVKFPDNTCI